jgi:hypothetical protein
MDEVRALRSDAARIIHQRLCGWINPGRSGRVTLDSLCAYAWPEPANPNTMKQRRQRGRAALVELHGIGWKLKEYARGKIEVLRPVA